MIVLVSMATTGSLSAILTVFFGRFLVSLVTSEGGRATTTRSVSNARRKRNEEVDKNKTYVHKNNQVTD